MSAIIQVILISLGVGVALALITRLIINQEAVGQKGRKEYFDQLKQVATAGVGVFSIVITFLVGCGYFTTYVPPQSILLTKQGAIQATFPEGIRLWKSDSRLTDTYRMSYEVSVMRVGMSVHPITENPKVIDFHYDVWVERLGNPSAVTDYYRTFILTNTAAETKLSYYLYQFNWEHSRELAIMYNPLDDEQQARFKQLVEDFLSPRLKGSGLTFKGARFKI